MARTFHRYVALGDSFTEGVGDPDPRLPNGVRGWADRVAEVLAQHRDARLRLRQPRDPRPQAGRDPRRAGRAGARAAARPGHGLRRRQRHPAPRRSTSTPSSRGTTTAVGRLAASRARTSCCSPASTSASRRCSGTCAAASRPTTSWSARSPTARGATVVDFWRMREYRDPRLWDVDRLHMSSAGHQRMAIAVLDALGVEHDLVPHRARDRCRRWTAASAGTPTSPGPGRTPRPWVQRRLRGTSSGDSLSPRWPTLAESARTHV